MSDPNLLHLDSLSDIIARCAVAGSMSDELDYERLGVCTPDLVALAKSYIREVIVQTAEAGDGITTAMLTLFLAGFDIGYQARLEIETRELVGKDNV